MDVVFKMLVKILDFFFFLFGECFLRLDYSDISYLRCFGLGMVNFQDVEFL